MAELLAKSATWGLEARQAGGIGLAPLETEPLYAIALFPRETAVAKKALARALTGMGLDWPAVGRISLGPMPQTGLTEGAGAPESPSRATVRLVWSGREEALLFGAVPPEGLTAAAAVTEQTGAYAGFAVTGAEAAQLLARLVPLDLRAKALPAGSAARSLAHHVPVLLLRPDTDRFELYAPRSMAGSLWHELNAALDRLAARRGS